MPADALAVWAESYAHSPESAAVKLHLGHLAYTRAMADDASALARAETRELIGSIRADFKRHVTEEYCRSVQEIKRAMDAKAQVASVASKCTSKGRAFEQELADALRGPAFACVSVTGERDRAGNAGCDLVLKSHDGSRLFVECKNTDRLTSADLDKFLRDVRAGSVKDTFAFVRKGGSGNSRMLCDKPPVEMIDGRVVVWWHDDETRFADNVQFLIALASQMRAHAASGATEEDLKSKCAGLRGALAGALRDVRADIESAQGTLRALQKRERGLVEAIESEGRAVKKLKHSAPMIEKVNYKGESLC